MKKIFSLMLVFVVILTSYAFVFAAENIENIKTMTDGTLPEGMLSGNFTVTSAEGFKGKTASDKVLKLTTKVGDSDPFISRGGATATKDGKTFKKYFVTRFNFYPEQANNLYLRTANNANVINKVSGSNFKLNEWNSILIYVDFTNINPDFDYAPITKPTEELKSIPEAYRSQICPVGHVFINGVEIGSGYMPTRLQDRFGMINTYYHPTEVGNYLAGTLSEISPKGPEHNSDWRLGFNPTDKTKQENAYIDDLYTYYTDVLPDASMPKITESSNVKVSDGNILNVYDEDMTVGELACPEGSSIVAYDTKNYGNIMQNSSYLYDGNLVIVKDSYGQMSSYTVSIQEKEQEDTEDSNDKEIIKTILDGALPSGMTKGTFTLSETDGFKGKNPSDKVLKLTTSVGDSDPFLSGGGAMATTDGKKYKKYFVTQFNFYPEQANNLYLRTANNANVIDKISGAEFKLNEWNSVLIYVDFTNINPDFDYAPITKPTEELKSIPAAYRSQICPVGHVFVNGVEVGGEYMPSRLQDRFGMINTYYHPTEVGKYLEGTLDTISPKGPENNMVWRLGFNPTDKTKQENAYIDDLYTYYTDVLPDVSMPKITENEQVTVTDGNMLNVYDEDMTVAELACAEGSSIIVYDNENYDNLMQDNSRLYDGNLVIVKDSLGKMSKYTVAMQQRNIAQISSTQTEITARANLYNAVLVFAGYDENGKLVELKHSSDIGENSLSISALCYKSKAFIFDSFEKIKPVTEEKMHEPTISVACWGDSITKGQGASGDSYAYPGVLASLTGYNVINMGVGGETATTVAARQGGIEIRLDEDITIPESGSVEIKFSAYEKDGTYAGVVTPRTTAGGWNPCYINGIEGTLSLEVDETKTPRILKWARFTRKQSGEAVDVPKGSVMTVEANKTKAHINIFMANANGGWSPENTTPKNSQVDSQIKLFDNMINNTPNSEKFIVMGLTIDGNWDETHKALEEKYGEHFLNIKEYLATKEALSDAFITPTAEDLAAISNKNVPPSLLTSDGVHLNDAGYGLIGAKVYEKMQQLGYAEKSIVKCWPEYKRKALTIGFDDCVKTDKLVIAELDTAGIKGTFNIVGDYLKNVSDDDLKIYEGHEIACHSQTHKMTLESSFEDVKADVVTGKETLHTRFPGYEIFGMARPAGYYSEELMNWLRSEDSGILYVRSDYHTGKDCSLNYELPEDWYRWVPTHTLKGIAGYNGSKDYVTEFFNDLKVKDSDTLKILFTWGHPIYFYQEGHDEGEHSIAALRKIIAEYKEHADEVWNGTHGEVYKYSKALDNLKIDRKNDTVYNPSDVDVYLIIGGEEMVVKAGETIKY